ncbi:hypothetical protein EYC84_005577 [Monilinia fructicola]|uniref:Uncharacterized protein n=1 Tax=Monilinia fructicola TaxID=38448 RepID=A0A5M9K5F4_MONFR|nr:hypothetical protein EYC84_005577 [Monilinia fructicola]
MRTSKPPDRVRSLDFAPPPISQSTTWQHDPPPEITTSSWKLETPPIPIGNISSRFRRVWLGKGERRIVCLWRTDGRDKFAENDEFVLWGWVWKPRPLLFSRN